MSELMNIFKDIYSRPRVYGTYAQLSLLREKERYQRRRGQWDWATSFDELVKAMGLERSKNSPMQDLVYAETPLYSLLRGAPQPPPKRMDQYDVAMWQRGKHG